MQNEYQIEIEGVKINETTGKKKFYIQLQHYYPNRSRRLFLNFPTENITLSPPVKADLIINGETIAFVDGKVDFCRSKSNDDTNALFESIRMKDDHMMFDFRKQFPNSAEKVFQNTINMSRIDSIVVVLGEENDLSSSEFPNITTSLYNSGIVMINKNKERSIRGWQYSC